MHEFWIYFIQHFSVEILLQLRFVFFPQPHDSLVQTFDLGHSWQFHNSSISRSHENIQTISLYKKQIRNVQLQSFGSKDGQSIKHLAVQFSSFQTSRPQLLSFLGEVILIIAAVSAHLAFTRILMFRVISMPNSFLEIVDNGLNGIAGCGCRYAAIHFFHVEILHGIVLLLILLNI